MYVNPEILCYVQEYIIPIYSSFDKARMCSNERIDSPHRLLRFLPETSLIIENSKKAQTA